MCKLSLRRHHCWLLFHWSGMMRGALNSSSKVGSEISEPLLLLGGENSGEQEREQEQAERRAGSFSTPLSESRARKHF